MIGETLEATGAAPVSWYFDRPVSNSGRLKETMAGVAEASGWIWDIRLINEVDKTVAAADAVAVSSDGWILDRADRWCDLTQLLLEQAGAAGRVIDLRHKP